MQEGKSKEEQDLSREKGTVSRKVGMGDSRQPGSLGLQGKKGLEKQLGEQVRLWSSLNDRLRSSGS